MESARRASEIHKRRTGRSLRVTEQDVINEEMYEEEDDDLPLQYRRLTAHLQTNSVDFNRRLAAYLTNQVAMRSAMEQMVNNSYNQQQFPNAQQYPGYPQTNIYSSPTMNHSMPPTPTNSYRSAPYPSPHQSGFRQMHGRAYSMAAPSEVSSNLRPMETPSTSSTSPDQRRMSTPANIPAASSIQPLDTHGIKPDPEYQRQTQSATTQHMPSSSNFAPLWQNMGPFTTSLPPESQQLLQGALDPNDPMTAVLMAGSDNYISNPYYPWGDMQSSGKPGQMAPSMHPSYHGMSATLAPSALENGPEPLSSTTVTSGASGDATSAPSSGLDFNFSQESTLKGYTQYSATGFKREDSASGLASGQVTPAADGFWDSFVQDGGWADEPTAT